MFIRKLDRYDSKSKNTYTEYRLVESYRNEDGKVKQKLLLNLGNNFSIPKDQWKLLVKIITEKISGQLAMIDYDPVLNNEAVRIANLLREKNATSYEINNTSLKAEQLFETVDLNNIVHNDVRTVGAEHIVLETLKKLELPEKLTELGFNAPQMEAAIGQIAARAINPSSELSTRNWLREYSGLGELIDSNFYQLTTDRLYRVSAQLLKNKNELENFLYQKEKDLFSLKNTITLFDLTNTYIEGTGKYNDKAAYGRSKEKRSDCKLVSLGLMLDGEGFPIKSEIFAGNIGEVKTLKKMLAKLGATDGDKPTIIFDAGIVSKENLQYCKGSGYDYLVVSKETITELPDGDIITIKDKGDDIVKVVKVEQENEVKLYCLSNKKKLREQEIESKLQNKLENILQKLSDGLSKKGYTKSYDKILDKIGQIKQEHKIAKNYNIKIIKDKNSKNAAKIEWELKENTQNHGMYCIRSSSNKLDEKTLWHTYMMITDIEATFRSMKSELGLRPIYHQKTDRVDGHIFISLLAYHVIHSIRYRLKKHNINLSWKSIREHLRAQIRLTSIFNSKDNRIIHIRKSSAPNIQSQEIYKALSLNYYPGKIVKSVFQI